jgi:hypothetical protein
MTDIVSLADTERPETKNSRALFVIDRVKNKLTGKSSTGSSEFWV